MRWLVCVCVAIATSGAAGEELRLEAASPPPEAGLSGPVLLTTDGEQASIQLRWTADPEAPVSLTGRRTKAETWWFAVPQEVGVARAPTPGLTELLGRVGRQTAGEAEVEGGLTTARLNLRAGPGLSSRVVETVDPGTRLVLSGTRRGEWLELTRGEQTLWAHRAYVLPGADSESLALEVTRRDARSFLATVRDGGQVRSRQVLTLSALRALLVNVGGDEIKDGVALRRALDPVERYYREQGYEVVRFPSVSPRDFLERLAAEEGRPFSRVVIATHSGWDGPIWAPMGIVSQVFAGTSGFARLAGQLQRSTTAEAKVYVSGCHAAGSNRYEPESSKIWIRDLAQSSQRTVGGPAGYTNAADHTYRQTLAVLEGEGRVVQETVLASPTELKRWGGGVASKVTPITPSLEEEPRSVYQEFIDEDDAGAEARSQLGLQLLNEFREALDDFDFDLDFGFDSDTDSASDFDYASGGPSPDSVPGANASSGR